MRKSLSNLAVLFVVAAVAYTLGSLQVLSPNPAGAQPAGAVKEDPLDAKIRKAHGDLKAIQKELVDSGRYVQVSDGVNSFAIMVGGVNALKDLEEGRGVDPETFAAIYAEQFKPELASKFKKDRGKNLWLYDGKPVLMYSEKRIKALWANRLKIAGVTPKSK